MKFIYKVIILIIFSLIFTNLVNAETIDDIEYKKSIKVWETIKIDLSEYIKKNRRRIWNRHICRTGYKRWCNKRMRNIRKKLW